jgi:hypothetical protein
MRLQGCATRAGNATRGSDAFRESPALFTFRTQDAIFHVVRFENGSEAELRLA